jgi:hypothetical protein
MRSSATVILIFGTLLGCGLLPAQSPVGDDPFAAGPPARVKRPATPAQESPKLADLFPRRLLLSERRLRTRAG